MSSLNSLRGVLDAWTGTVAGAVVAGLERVVAPRVVRLVETETGAFALEVTKPEDVPNEIAFEDGKFVGANLAQIVRGSRVEIVLRPARFLFRPLELPARAADFLDGIVRAQIDRLTPWSASEAVFGCSPPVAHGGESITTEIAAAPRRLAMGYVEAVSGFHPSAIAIVTEAGGGGRIKVFEQKSRGAIDPVRLSRTLQAVLALAVVAAVVGSVAAGYLADSLSAQESELERQITQRRAALPRQRRRRALAARPARAPQIRDAGERDRAGVAEPAAAGSYLCHRDASFRQQDPDRRHHPRCALVDPADRAVPAFHPRDLLRPHDA
ncbi:hypothetical protein ACVJF1_000619 [Bradyrhizobium diazoefficiens]